MRNIRGNGNRVRVRVKVIVALMLCVQVFLDVHFLCFFMFLCILHLSVSVTNERH